MAIQMVCLGTAVRLCLAAILWLHYSKMAVAMQCHSVTCPLYLEAQGQAMVAAVGGVLSAWLQMNFQLWVALVV